MNIFITGVSKGIGRELVRQLVKKGHTVWGIARRGDLLLTLEKEVGKARFFFTVCDVGDESEVVETIQVMKKRAFTPDVIILNSAVYAKDVILHYNRQLVMNTFMINLFGALTWVEKFKRGHFIAISSTSAFRPDPNSVALPASKAALSMAFRSLRIRYSGEKIIFSTIHFGPVATTISPNYVSRSGGPKYPFVFSAFQAAQAIQKVIAERKAKDYFFPFFTTLVFRLTFFFPDTLFAKVSRFLKK